MADRIRRSGTASQNEIMSAVKSVSVMIPMVEDFTKRILALEEEVAALKAASKPSKLEKSEKD